LGEKESKYAEVVIDSPVRGLDRPFHYLLPERFRKQVEIGSMVVVPVRERLMLAYVIDFPTKSRVEGLKEISSVIDEPPVFDFDGQRLCRWISYRYLSPLSQAIRLLTPPGRRRKVRQMIRLTSDRDIALFRAAGKADVEELVEVLSASGETDTATLERHLCRAGLSERIREACALGIAERRFMLGNPEATRRTRKVVRMAGGGGFPPDGLTTRQKDIYDYLIERGGVDFQSELLGATGVAHGTLKSLEKKGVVEIVDEEVLRTPRLRGRGEDKKPDPNQEQAAAIAEICGALDRGIHHAFLLEGVTGSGKTEVYLRCIERALGQGRGAIVLVPEISLTPQTVERFELRFPGQVAVLHSRLGTGERFDQWRGIQEGRYRVVVGARSALFAPVERLGVIAIDEEHETTYKSDTAPRYHARDVAEARARMAGAVLVLGSATPSLESLERARAGAYGHLRLRQRIDSRPLPTVEVVDMRSAGGAGTVPLLSGILLDAVSRTVEAGDQAILFLNRRGFSNYLQCHRCGHIMGCDSCEVSLCYHRRGEVLRCHHCDTRFDVPKRCPECGRGPLKGFGAGTQRVEEVLKAQIPGVSCIRMDADTTSTKDAHWRLLESFKAREAQVLIGTQMIAKGLDIPAVTLVGVINADTALALPDFRSSERTYQLLTQVSGRAGRGLRPGRVVVQTFSPEHPAIKAVNGDVETFFKEELESRLHALYPPFTRLVNVLVTSADSAAAARSASRMKHILGSDLEGSGARILGPAPAPLSRLKGNYRWHILVKSNDLEGISPLLRRSSKRFYGYSKQFPAGAEVRVSMDVEPVSLL
jgi:primosomal protein N' (replication factor Y) (superfamily II helicase)